MEKKKSIRKNYGSSLEGFERDEIIFVAQIAEQAIVKWPVEMSDLLDISIPDLSKLKAKLTEYLDEEDCLS